MITEAATGSELARDPGRFQTVALAAAAVSSRSFTRRLAAQARRELLAFDLSQQQHAKAAHIARLPLFAVALAGKSGMDSEYAKHVHSTKGAMQ